MKEWRATGAEVPVLKNFDHATKAYMQHFDIPNGALAVAIRGRLVLARGYTWAEPTHETTHPTSLFRIASCTKPITAIAIYRLVERGVKGSETQSRHDPHR